jgi:Probable molybdopterin binding domain
MAKFCFSLGMQMKRVEVIADDEDEIIEATTRMSKNYDFVVTSGGIGPTYVSPFILFTLPSQFPIFDRKNDADTAPS